MPRKFTAWTCCKCANSFDTEEKALECENKHVSMNTLYRQSYIIGGHIPDKLFFIGSDDNKYVYRFDKSLGKA